MSDAPWTGLAATFAPTDVAWDVVAVEDDGETAVVTPRLRAEALRARLDHVCGVGGWSVEFAPFAGGAVGCTVRVREVAKSAVADAARAGATATAEAAFAAAAELLAMLPPVARHARRVPFDADAGVVLHEPAPEPDAHGEGLPPADGPSTSGAPDLVASARGARGLPPELLTMIERLVERLRDQGMGLAAARLLNRYGGYGKDPAAARELYGELRALLVREGG